MKITILALHLGYGGVEKFITNIANMFADENEVHIISTYKIFEKPVFKINPKVKISYLMENLKPNREEFYESIKKFNIINIIKQTYIALKILYIRKHKMKKSIMDIQEGVVISTRPLHNKLLSKYGNNSLNKIATEHNYDLNNNKYIRKVINSCKNLDYLVIASKELSKNYSKKMSHYKCRIVNIPLSLDYVPNETSNLEEKGITYIGRLSKEKGILDLIEVFKEVYDKDNKVILNIVGEGEEEEELKNRIQRYNLNDNVILHGYKSREEVENILLNTSIGVNTSYRESFGLAILETMSYGIPCIAFSSAEGLKEIIKNEKNGYIIENRNFEQMANSILELINDREKRIRFAEEAKKTCLKYERKEIRKKWMEIINN